MMLDNSYMSVNEDFTVNSTLFPDLKNYTESLHQQNIKMVLAIGPGLKSFNKENTYYA